MDLSLTIRFANLSPGAKLDMVRVKNSQEQVNPNRILSLTTIALQLDDGRYMAQFPSNTSLWQILRHFEQTIGQSLTERIEGDNYQQPVIVYLANEFGTIPVLRSTTLLSMGLGSGSAVLRVNFRAVAKDDGLLLEAAQDVLPEASAVPEKPQPKAPVEKKVTKVVPENSVVTLEVETVDRQLKVLKPSSSDGSNASMYTFLRQANGNSQ